jgi:signal transduction histidine kinase
MPAASRAHDTREAAVLRHDQQIAAAELGLRAIDGIPLDDLYAYAVDVVRGALEADFAWVVQLRENGQLVVRAHSGPTDPNPVGRVLDAGHSVADQVIRTGEPVVTADRESEEGFLAPLALHEGAARSAAAVPVRGRRGIFGAQVAMNRMVHHFQPSDVAFLQTCANVIAAAVDRADESAALRETQEALDRSQQQLNQAVKMEAVGRLAGGIAHDFNNLLTAIRGYSDLVLASLPADNPIAGDVLEIQRAADRAASLTQQLLAFSRRQVLRPARIDLGAVVTELTSMIRRVIGADVELDVCACATRTVLADRGQIEQVIMNLAVNARDAMPSGGTLRIDACDHDVETPDLHREGAPPPGRYALVRVQDSGTGIPPEILDRIFEPFFTTKKAGKGTGLGLSTAYGIVKQSGGFIEVSSDAGRGTSFEILLPEADPVASKGADPGPRPLEPHRSGGETVLVVEDEDAVRHVVQRALKKLGYHVLEASGGAQAITLALQHGSDIDLVLTDFVMPHMGGRELIDRLRELGITPRILVMSGYVDDASVRSGGFPKDAAFVEKPFTAEGIGRKVREVLDAPMPGVARPTR